MTLEHSSGGLSSRDGTQLADLGTANAQSDAKDSHTTDRSNLMKDGSPSDSDNDNNNERPVREKLKKANLGTLHRVASNEDIDVDEDAVMQSQTTAIEAERVPGTNDKDSSNAAETAGMSVSRGRPARKRSFDDVEVDDIGDDMKTEDASGNKTRRGWESGTHARKRSRDVSTGSGSMSHDSVQGVGSGGSFVNEGSEELNGESYPSGFPGANPVSNTGVRTPAEVMDEDNEPEPVVSPRRPERKRSRDQFDKDQEKEELEQSLSREKDEKSAGGEVDPDITARCVSRTSRDEPEKKRHRDTSQEADSKEEKKLETKIPPTSGFANTSAISPFGTLASKAPSVFGSGTATTAQTSSSAFASSGFAALSGSSTSPFGALGTSPPSSSPFGALGAAKSTGASGFGTLLSTGKSGPAPSGSFGGTPFGMTSSGFSGLGSGFGGVSGVGLRDFSSNGGSGIIGLKEKPHRPFGAPEDETEESGDETSGDEANGEDGKEGKKEDVDVEKRFHPQEVETGEEGETTIFSCRAKLFYFDKEEKAWKERGVGLFKLNATATEVENEYDRWSRSSDDSTGEEAGDSTTKNADNKRKARLLMRADGVLRVVLNVPVFKGMKVGDEKGNPPTGRMVTFTALEDGKAVPLLVKTSSPANAKELCKHISEIQQEV
ncbi:hypothetical protein FGG08_001555 [Glutinoglossum americanum]|uniref:RanBD1 domain-containing protein n=1 Tax=Glutinoglossum americanum TaxID=1670608 RepID=A0A9P8I819_9PEZI|nr:hypothetical protein FGG08_001555 [Glutinoglossum americanum]